MENIETLLAAVAQTQEFDDDEPSVSTTTGLGLEKSESSAGIRDDSGDARLSAVVDVPTPAQTPAFPVAGLVIDAVEKKKKRGRPKGQLAVKPPPSKRNKLENEEEDVCFICFDGGSLVLCDRKGCPKAYHPACIKRDEAFFQSKAKWNCGWHICSVCRRASRYVCYTCTYSLCKGCIKDSDYLCVRGNNGFCSICMKTIMLIENKDHADNESVEVDFDDITSWEYLFKVYWVILKEKLSLTLDELTQAKNPWKIVATVCYEPLSRNTNPIAVSVEGNSTEHLESNNETAPPSTGINIEKINNDTGECGPAHDRDMAKPIMDGVTCKMSIEKVVDEVSKVEDTEKKCVCKNTNNKELDKPEINSSSTEWATKDLLEFVSHMKNGDTSAMPQFDVQTLLLDYIKINHLRDPRRKSQIICDQRLKNLFGKPRVGHIEMLKLLEFHFLTKEDSKKDSFIPAGLVSSAASEMEVDGNTYGLLTPINSRKRKSRKKTDERAPSQNNLNEYAAIDVHNINLIYLRRNLMENLIEDHENFNNKVIGSIVRIRISGNDQKQDVHRLVQVVGTTKVDEPYKIGDKTADVMLEVLNLDKKEVVSIDAITNQEFTEDECRRLRQSIRCGLVKHFTVGEVQNKAMALQPVRVNDCLEAEISRLNHLRDRASENGRKKELRDHVTKLQLLKSPKERSRRISEIPEIHADPKMSPDYESEEETKSGGNSRKEDYARPSYLGVPRKNERKPISSNKKDKEERTIPARNRVREKTDASRPINSEKHTNQVNVTNSITGGRNIQARSGSVGYSPSSIIIETEKLWHYSDPNGKIQGPFSMAQLRKWNTTGLFPPNMRIWTNHEQYDSLLLTDALNGKLNLASDPSNSGSRKEEATTGAIELVSADTNVRSRYSSKQTEQASGSDVIGLISEGTNVSSRDSKQTEPASGSDVIGLIRKGTNASNRDSKQTEPAVGSNATGLISEDAKRSEGTNVSSRDSKQTESASGSDVIGLISEGTTASSRDSKQTEPVLGSNVIGLIHESEKINEGTNTSSRDSKQTEQALCNNVLDTNMPSKQTLPALGTSSTGLITEGTNASSRDSKQTEQPLCSNVTGLITECANASSGAVKKTEPTSGSDVIGLISERTKVSSGDSKQTEPALDSSVSVSFENNTGLVKPDESGGSWPMCWDLLKDNNSNVHNDVQARNLLPLSNPEKTPLALPSPGRETENRLTTGNEFKKSTNFEECVQVPSEENLKSLNIDLSLNDMECGSASARDSDKPGGNLSVLDLLSLTPRAVDIEQSDVPLQNFEILELLSPTPRLNNQDQAIETKQQSEFINFPAQIWSNASSLGLGEVQLPEIDEWRGYSPTPAKPPENTSENVVATSTSNIPTWLMTINDTIELDAFGEESVSDLLAEVDAMELRGALPSPTSAMKFARELLEDCKDDCFSSIEDFSRKSDAFSSTSEIQLNSEPSSSKPMINNTTFDFLTRSSVHSSTSSEGETNHNAPVYWGDSGLEFQHFPVPNIAQDVVGASMGHGIGSDCVDPNWGTVQGNINMVTVQGNVNLVLGGPAAQGMANLGWGANQGTGWANPNLNMSPGNGLGSVPWDPQRKFGGERFTSPREWGGYQDSGFGRGRPLWGRQPSYGGGGGGGGGYSRAALKGQRVCKFYGSGHCRKGAFCDYLHP